MLNAIVVTNLINLESVHASMYLLGNLVKNACVDNTTTTYSLYLLRGLYQTARRNRFAFILPIHNLLVKLGNGLARQTMPYSFFLKNHICEYD